MNATDRRRVFDDWRARHRMTIEDFAWLVGLDECSVRRWGREGRPEVPPWVILLIDAWDLCGGPPLVGVVALAEE